MTPFIKGTKYFLEEVYKANMKEESVDFERVRGTDWKTWQEIQQKACEDYLVTGCISTRDGYFISPDVQITIKGIIMLNDFKKVGE